MHVKMWILNFLLSYMNWDFLLQAVYKTSEINISTSISFFDVQHSFV